VNRVEQLPVPPQAHELAGLERIDYADCFAVAVTAQRSPEEWLRAAVEAMPALFRGVRIAHRALGLRLAAADAPGHVIGWEVLRSEPDVAMLGNVGVLGKARIIGLTEPGRVLLATLIEMNGTVGGALWAVAAPAHRAVARRALGALSADRERIQ
jgi:hypothetical protein